MSKKRVGCLWLNKEEISLNACFHSVFSTAVNFDHMVSYDQWHRRKRSGTEQATRDDLDKLGALKSFELDGIHWSILGSWIKQSQRH